MPAQLAETGYPFAGPVFLRKLPRKNSLGDPNSSAEERAGEVARSIFLSDPKPYSVFLVSTAEEFRRVCIGYNGGRTSLTSELYWLPLLGADLTACGLQTQSSPGETRCDFANQRHHDIDGDEEKVRQLCRRIIEQQISCCQVRKSQLTTWVEIAKAENCLAVQSAQGCGVASCPQPTVPLTNSPS